MTANIVLGIRLSPNSFQRVSISGVNLESKVEQLKLEASKATNLPKHFLGKSMNNMPVGPNLTLTYGKFFKNVIK